MKLSTLVSVFLLIVSISGCRHTAPSTPPASPDVTPTQQASGAEEPGADPAAIEGEPAAAEKAAADEVAPAPTPEAAAAASDPGT